MNVIILQIIQQSQAVIDTLSNTAGYLSSGLTEIRLSIWEMVLKGGWIMLPLGLLSVITVYIFIERFIIIVRASRDERNFMNHIRDFVHGGKIDAANAMCKSYSNPIARMIEKGLARIGRPLNDINAAIENVGKLEVAKLEKNIAGLY